VIFAFFLLQKRRIGIILFRRGSPVKWYYAKIGKNTTGKVKKKGKSGFEAGLLPPGATCDTPQQGTLVGCLPQN